MDAKIRVKENGEWIDLEQSIAYKGDPEAVRATVEQLVTLDDLVLWAGAAMTTGTVTAVRFTMECGDVCVHVGLVPGRLQFSGWWREER